MLTRWEIFSKYILLLTDLSKKFFLLFLYVLRDKESIFK